MKRLELKESEIKLLIKAVATMQSTHRKELIFAQDTLKKAIQINRDLKDFKSIVDYHIHEIEKYRSLWNKLIRL